MTAELAPVTDITPGQIIQEQQIIADTAAMHADKIRAERVAGEAEYDVRIAKHNYVPGGPAEVQAAQRDLEDHLARGRDRSSLSDEDFRRRMDAVVENGRSIGDFAWGDTTTPTANLASEPAETVVDALPEKAVGHISVEAAMARREADTAGGEGKNLVELDELERAMAVGWDALIRGYHEGGAAGRRAYEEAVRAQRRTEAADGWRLVNRLGGVTLRASSATRTDSKPLPAGEYEPGVPDPSKDPDMIKVGNNWVHASSLELPTLGLTKRQYEKMAKKAGLPADGLPVTPRPEVQAGRTQEAKVMRDEIRQAVNADEEAIFAEVAEAIPQRPDETDEAYEKRVSQMVRDELEARYQVAVGITPEAWAGRKDRRVARQARKQLEGKEAFTARWGRRARNIGRAALGVLQNEPLSEEQLAVPSEDAAPVTPREASRPKGYRGSRRAPNEPFFYREEKEDDESLLDDLLGERA